jgi:hypothetical protein
LVLVTLGLADAPSGVFTLDLADETATPVRVAEGDFPVELGRAVDADTLLVYLTGSGYELWRLPPRGELEVVQSLHGSTDPSFLSTANGYVVMSTLGGSPL